MSHVFVVNGRTVREETRRRKERRRRAPRAGAEASAPARPHARPPSLPPSLPRCLPASAALPQKYNNRWRACMTRDEHEPPHGSPFGILESINRRRLPGARPLEPHSGGRLAGLVLRTGGSATPSGNPWAPAGKNRRNGNSSRIDQRLLNAAAMGTRTAPARRSSSAPRRQDAPRLPTPHRSHLDAVGSDRC